MADRLLDGHLVDRLTELRGEGLSTESIARTLYAEAGVHVSARTVSKWCQQIGLDAEPESVSA